jgi:phenylalanyl-tRNA synthetase beta chain
MANSLTTASYNSLSDAINDDHNVEMLNPLSQDLGVMRQSMLFSGLEAVAHNINRKRSDLRLFEFGKTYHNYESGREEYKHLSLFVTGNSTEERWNATVKPSDFFYLKGIIDAVLERLGLNQTTSAPTKQDILSEGLVISKGKHKLVNFGLVKKSVLKGFGIAQPLLYADFNWDNILSLAKHNAITFAPIPKYPEVRRDFALLIDNTVSFDDIYSIAKNTEKKLLKNINLFDVYEGENLPEGKKSYAVSFTLQDENKTLTDKQIDKIMSKLQANFENKLGAELR